MAVVYKIDYRDGRSQDFWAPSDYYYLIGPDELLRMHTIPAWCPSCNNITIAESLKTPRELEREMKESEDPQSHLHQRHFAGRPREDLERWQARLKRELAHSMQ